MEVSVRSEKDLIHNAYEILDSGKHWTKHRARIGDSFCVSGALVEAANRAGQLNTPMVSAASRLITESINRLFVHRSSSIPAFNDSARTSWEDVDAVFQDAMQK